jgi:hypothetical protein
MGRLPWFKLFTEIRHDPKIKRLSPEQRWFWIVLLCLAAESDERHVVRVTESVAYSNQELARECGYDTTDECAYGEEPVKMIERSLKEFVALKMISIREDGTIEIINFEKRQDTNLTDAERAAKYRERKRVTQCNVTNVTRVTQPSVTNVTLEVEVEGEGEKKRINTLAHSRSEGFEKFWSAYPKKISKGQAEKAWSSLRPNEQLLVEILQGIERAKTSANWRKDGGQYIPYPATWLRAKGWEDQLCGASHEELEAEANERRLKIQQELLAGRRAIA